jgi:positive regulator of sigma E activity
MIVQEVESRCVVCSGCNGCGQAKRMRVEVRDRDFTSLTEEELRELEPLVGVGWAEAQIGEKN